MFIFLSSTFTFLRFRLDSKFQTVDTLDLEISGASTSCSLVPAYTVAIKNVFSIGVLTNRMHRRSGNDRHLGIRAHFVTGHARPLSFKHTRAYLL